MSLSKARECEAELSNLSARAFQSTPRLRGVKSCGPILTDFFAPGGFPLDTIPEILLIIEE